MANKYLEKLAAHYEVAPHSDHREYNGVKSVSLNEHEMHRYSQAHRDKDTLKGRLGYGAVGGVGGRIVGGLADKAIAHGGRGGKVGKLGTTGKVLGTTIGLLAGAGVRNTVVHDRAMEQAGFHRDFKHRESD